MEKIPKELRPPKATLKRFINLDGFRDIRITGPALETLQIFCVDYIRHYTKLALKVTYGDKRLTVHASDIEAVVPYIGLGKHGDASIPLNVVRRIAKSVEPKLRISKDALVLLRVALDTRIEQVSYEASRIVKYKGVKTINPEALRISFRNTQREMATGINCEKADEEELNSHLHPSKKISAQRMFRLQSEADHLFATSKKKSTMLEKRKAPTRKKKKLTKKTSGHAKKKRKVPDLVEMDTYEPQENTFSTGAGIYV